MKRTSKWGKLFPLVGFFLAVVTSACGPRVEPADLILLNGKVVTVNPEKPQAQAIAVRGDIIAAVGAVDEIRRYVGPDTQVLDLGGMLAIPGFIEGHGHFTSLGESKMNLDLTRAANWDEIVAMVREAAGKAKPGEYILGRGWHQEKWNKGFSPSVEGFPVHDLLSKAVELKDPASQIFLQWYVTEQVEEEKSADEIVHNLKLIQDSPGPMFMLDQHMAARKFKS